MILPSLNWFKRNKRKKDVGKRPINSSCSLFLPFPTSTHKDTHCGDLRGAQDLPGQSLQGRGLESFGGQVLSAEVM